MLKTKNENENLNNCCIFLEKEFDSLNYEKIIEVMEFIFNLSFNNSNHSEELKNKVTTAIGKFFENNEKNIKMNIINIFKEQEESGIYMDSENELFKFDFNKETVESILKNFSENFYFGLYELESLIAKDICKNLVNSITARNKIPNKNYYLNEEVRNLELTSISISVDKSHSNFFEDEDNIKYGRFGLCSKCKNNADFYCIKTRLPICSFECKEKIIFEDNFLNFMSILKNLINNKITHDGENTCNEQIKNLKNVKFHLEKIIQWVIAKLLPHSTSNSNSEDINKTKLLIEILIKILKGTNILLDSNIILKFKSSLTKIIFKFFHSSDKNTTHNINTEILLLNLDLFLIILKNYGSIFKTEFGLLLEELIKIITPNNFPEEEKIKPILKFLEKLFLLHKKRMIFFIFNNFDNQIGHTNIVKDLIEVLFQIIHEKTSSNISIKQRGIKILFKIIEIINLHSLSIKSIKENQSANSDAPLYENKIAKIKQNYSNCKETFNQNYKEISKVIIERKINTEEEPLTKFLAKFLRFTPGLDKEKIGLVLGSKNEFNLEVYECYLNTFNFANLNIADALRNFLFCFKISGESQIIDRIISKFSIKYFEDNIDTEMRKYIDHSDSAYYLSFNIMILHTNMHNPNVNLKDKINLHIFCKTLNGLNNGKNFDDDFLKIVYDNIKNAEFFIHDSERYRNNSNKKLIIDSFNLQVDLLNSQDKNTPDTWLLITSDFFITNCGKIILDYFFQNLILFLDIILSQKDKKIIYTFYEFFNFFLEVVENLKLIQEKISIINFWVKLLDFKAIDDISSSNKLRSIKIFSNTLKNKSFLFSGCWKNILTYLVNKYTYIEKVNMNIASHTKNDLFSSLALKQLVKIFSKEKIENCFLLSLKLDENNFVEFINTLFEILVQDLEYNLSLNKFIIDEVGGLIMKYPNKMRIWGSVFIKTKKLLKTILGTTNFNIEENVLLIFEFITVLYNSFILEDDVVFMESFNSILEIIYVSLREDNNYKTSNIVDCLVNSFKDEKVLQNIFVNSRFIVFIINLLKKEQKVIKNIFYLIENLFKESVSVKNKNICFLFDHNIFSLLENLFYIDFEFYQNLIKIIICNACNILSSNGHINLFTHHLNGLINKFFNNFENGEDHFSKILKIFKIVNSSNSNNNGLSFFYEGIFQNLLQCQLNIGSNIILVSLLDKFTENLLTNLQTPKTFNFDINTLEILIKITENYSLNLNKNFDIFTKLNIFINNCKNDDNFLSILLFNSRTYLRILEEDKKYFEENNISFSENNTYILLNDITNHSFYVKLKNKIKGINFDNKLPNVGDIQNLQFNEIILNLYKEIEINLKFFVEPLDSHLKVDVIKEYEDNDKYKLLSYIEILLINLTYLINLSIFILNLFYEENSSNNNRKILNVGLCKILKFIKIFEGNSIALNYLLEEVTQLFSELIELNNLNELNKSDEENIPNIKSILISLKNKELINLLIETAITDNRKYRKKVIELILILNK